MNGVVEVGDVVMEDIGGVGDWEIAEPDELEDVGTRTAWAVEGVGGADDEGD